jgi:hypothetical protein
MKLHPYLLTIIIALLFCFHTIAQNVNLGLMTHYCLNGDAQDAVGGKHVTPMQGTTGVMDRSFNPNGAVQLDGIDDYIQLPSDTWITEDFTKTTWA